MHKRIVDHANRIRRQFGKQVTLGGKNFKVTGYISNLLSVDSDHERELDQVLARLLERDGHFIDVGMNLGQTLGKVISLDPQREYLGFEPQILPCALVAGFLKDNQLVHCHVFPFGLSDSDGIRNFFSGGTADVTASLIEAEDNRTVSFVPVRSGDVVLSDLGIEKICAIKIDVEGAELEVLEGLSGTIGTHGPPVIFEVLPNFVGKHREPVSENIAARQRDAAARIFNFFCHKHGYQIFQLSEDSEEHLISEFELDRTDIFRGSNYIARRPDGAGQAEIVDLQEVG